MKNKISVKLQTLKKGKQSVKLESKEITRGKLIEAYIHCNRAAKNTSVDMEFTTTKSGQSKLIKDR